MLQSWDPHRWLPRAPTNGAELSAAALQRETVLVRAPVTSPLQVNIFRETQGQ